jgi:hypothetical protein
MPDLKIKATSATELLCCITQKLAQITTVSSNKELGHRLFFENKLELKPFQAVPFSGWGDWEQDPLNNRSWQWRLNWFPFISYLLAYHCKISNDAVLDLAKAGIESWLDAYLDTDTSYPFEFIWHDHGTALRAEQFLLFSYYCRFSAPEWVIKNKCFLDYLKNALFLHGNRLSQDSFYSQHTNHGLEQARVLLLLGTVFDGEQAFKWQRIAINRIGNELNYAFTTEGVHVENSPAYHLFVFKVFMGIIEDYPAEALGELRENFARFSAKALDFATRILRPDGLLPPIGDTEQLATSDSYHEFFAESPAYQNFQYAHSKGKKGVVPSAINRVYPLSGYAVFRDKWHSTIEYEQAFHIIVKVGCSSRYHHQQDEGHVSVFAGGEDWLIDSGLFNYNNKDPLRKYMRSRAAHNVPLISHCSYSEDFEHRLRAWQVTSYDEAPQRPFVEMKLEVMPPVVHERRVDFDSQTQVLEVRDVVFADDNQSRNINFQWHFPKDKSILIEGNTVLVNSPKGNRLRINFDGEAPDRLLVVSGRKDDRVFSCISYKANHWEPSQLLQVIYQERKALTVTTRMNFEIL